MPLIELELHPYLDIQLNNSSSLLNYNKLLVGTFPTYEVTKSKPVERLGNAKREHWPDSAVFKYFYGSKKNHLWQLIASSFNGNLPNSLEEAISLADTNNIFLTDVYSGSFRNAYSPLDCDLVDPILNYSLKTILNTLRNIQAIYFTSVNAKRIFCKILGISFEASNDILININGYSYRFIVLPSPAGNGRTVKHFFKNFPLTTNEIVLKENKRSYALSYRSRYYEYFFRTL